jgi:Tol biopolymer transport system component
MKRFTRYYAYASFLLAMATLATIGARPAAAAATGEFLFVENAVAGRGGIWGVDVTGTSFFGITAAQGSGFSVPGPPYPDPNIWEFSQAKNNGRIAFMSSMNPNDSQRIYVMNGDGAGVTEVTFHNPSVGFNQGHFLPSISADGSKIVYVNGETIAPPGTQGANGADCSGSNSQSFWVVNSDGTDPHVIRQPTDYDSHCNHGQAGEAVWSPDGSKLLVSDGFGDFTTSPGCQYEIVVVDSSGNPIKTLACNNGAGITQVGLDWSPDGTKAMALVACGGGGGQHTCTQWVVWDTSTWDVISTIPTPSGNDEFLTRFSPDSSLLGYYDQNTNPHTIQIMDLSGNPVSSLNMSSVNVSPGGFAGSLVWSSSMPGTLHTITLGVPSVYVNACSGYTLYLDPSVFNSSGALVTHGYTSANIDINSGDGDSFHVDGFGNAFFNATRNSGSGTLQLSNFGINSPTVSVTADQNCTCQATASGISVTRGGLRYVTSSQDQFVQTLTVKNATGSTVAGPINVVLENLTSTVILTNASGTSGCASPGSYFTTAVPAGSSLAPNATASVVLYFRDPSLAGFNYTTAVVAGAGAP